MPKTFSTTDATTQLGPGFIVNRVACDIFGILNEVREYRARRQAFLTATVRDQDKLTELLAAEAQTVAALVRVLSDTDQLLDTIHR